jgi:hypothetical protein
MLSLFNVDCVKKNEKSGRPDSGGFSNDEEDGANMSGSESEQDGDDDGQDNCNLADFQHPELAAPTTCSTGKNQLRLNLAGLNAHVAPGEADTSSHPSYANDLQAMAVPRQTEQVPSASPPNVKSSARRCLMGDFENSCATPSQDVSRTEPAVHSPSPYPFSFFGFQGAAVDGQEAPWSSGGVGQFFRNPDLVPQPSAPTVKKSVRRNLFPDFEASAALSKDGNNAAAHFGTSSAFDVPRLHQSIHDFPLNFRAASTTTEKNPTESPDQPNEAAHSTWPTLKKRSREEQRKDLVDFEPAFATYSDPSHPNYVSPRQPRQYPNQNFAPTKIEVLKTLETKEKLAVAGIAKLARTFLVCCIIDVIRNAICQGRCR